MSGKTGIQWTDTTWNPVVGCTKVSQGCKHCYAKTLHDRRHKAALAGKDVAPQYAQPFETVQLMPARVEQPLSWAKPRRVFVNSVSDLFHEDVPDEFLDRVFAVMQAMQQHTFQILTKRPARARDYLCGGAEFRVELAGEVLAAEHEWCHANEGREWPLSNVWLGTSVENQEAADERIPQLLQTQAALLFLSLEPLLDAVNLTSIGSFRGEPLSALEECVGYVERPRVDWVIVGGESGKGARPCNIEWVRAIVAQCRAAGVPAFVKQLGADPHALGRMELRDSHGGDMTEWPEDLRVRQFPRVR